MNATIAVPRAAAEDYEWIGNQTGPFSIPHNASGRYQMTWVMRFFCSVAFLLAAALGASADEPILFSTSILNKAAIGHIGSAPPVYASNEFYSSAAPIGNWPSSIDLTRAPISGHSDIVVSAANGEATIRYDIQHELAAGNHFLLNNPVTSEVSVQVWAPLGDTVQIEITPAISLTPGVRVEMTDPVRSFPRADMITGIATAQRGSVVYDGVTYGTLNEMFNSGFSKYSTSSLYFTHGQSQAQLHGLAGSITLSSPLKFSPSRLPYVHGI
ncbi:MAG: hypothetical protein WD851_00790, partial [Pirellulales bacterium]